MSEPRTRSSSLLSRFWHGIASYAVKFGVVGIVGLVIDVSLFNLLRLGVFGDDHFAQSPVGAKIISVSVAIAFNWLGSRYWAFRANRRRNWIRELGEYVTVSLGGLAIGVLCLWVSHYVLGFDNLFADNIASNVVGLGLGTVFRFTLYRYWVYGHHRSDTVEAPTKVEAAERSLFEERSERIDG